jgi:hypothetical protein
MKLFGENTKYISYSYDPLLRWYMTQVYGATLGGLVLCFAAAQLHIKEVVS